MTPAAELLRTDQELIAELIPAGARVLDLGCGDGALLATLRDEHGALVRGMELDLAKVAGCVARGLSVVQHDLDEGLSDFPDGSFDVVVLSQTLQVVRRPAFVLSEMVRVGARGLVSFPNFAYWRNRAHLAFRGKMPVSKAIPYTWYETPNIHHTTLRDFRELCDHNGIVVQREIPLVTGSSRRRTLSVLPNLRADSAVFVVSKR